MGAGLGISVYSKMYVAVYYWSSGIYSCIECKLIGFCGEMYSGSASGVLVGVARLAKFPVVVLLYACIEVIFAPTACII